MEHDPVVLKAIAIMAEYTYFKHPFPDAIKTFGWLRKAWKRAEEVIELRVDMSTESRNYVSCRPP